MGGSLWLTLSRGKMQRKNKRFKNNFVPQNKYTVSDFTFEIKNILFQLDEASGFILMSFEHRGHNRAYRDDNQWDTDCRVYIDGKIVHRQFLGEVHNYSLDTSILPKQLPPFLEKRLHHQSLRIADNEALYRGDKWRRYDFIISPSFIIDIWNSESTQIGTEYFIEPGNTFGRLLQKEYSNAQITVKFYNSGSTDIYPWAYNDGDPAPTLVYESNNHYLNLDYSPKIHFIADTLEGFPGGGTAGGTSDDYDGLHQNVTNLGEQSLGPEAFNMYRFGTHDNTIFLFEIEHKDSVRTYDTFTPTLHFDASPTFSSSTTSAKSQSYIGPTEPFAIVFNGGSIPYSTAYWVDSESGIVAHQDLPIKDLKNIRMDNSKCYIGSSPRFFQVFSGYGNDMTGKEFYKIEMNATETTLT